MYNNSMGPTEKSFLLLQKSIEKSFLLLQKFWWTWLENNFTFLGRLNIFSEPSPISISSPFQIQKKINPNEFRWYASDVVLLGYKYCERRRPLFWAYNPHTKISVLREFNMEEAERELQILEALANPDLLPLCLNTWAESFAAEYFARE